MTKKFLCLMLCLVLILSTFIIQTMGAATSDYIIEDGTFYSTDFESGFTPLTSVNMMARVKKTEGENTYYEVKANDTAIIQIMNVSQDAIASNSVITFDVRCDNNSAPLYVYSNTSAGWLAVGVVGDVDNTWYTYKIEVGDYTGQSLYDNHATLVKVYKKECGAADSTYVQLTNGFDNASSTWNKNVDCEYVYAKTTGTNNAKTGMGYLFYRATDTDKMSAQYSIDNFAIIKKNTVTSKKATFVEDSGNITPTFPTVSGCEAAATAITAVYDAAGNKISATKATVSINAGISKTSAPVVVANTVPAGGRIEAMLWESDTSIQPIAPVSVYGTAAKVDSSDAAGFTYSVKANEITVENGGLAEDAVVTLKAVGDDNSFVYATQFETTDGSFKKVFPVDYSGNVTVTVSTPDETFDFTVTLGDWTGFKTAFENLDKDSADEFFDNYAHNFTVNINGTETNLLDGVTLDAATMSNIGYLKSIKNYDADMTYSEIVDAVVDLATKDVAEVNAFMSEFADAKALSEADMTQAVEDIRELLQNATFLTFDRTSDVICKALLSSDATDIESFWADYVVAKEAQATEEAAQIPGLFAGIGSAEEMEGFFNETISISGTDYTIKETLGLTGRLTADTNYAVMYGAYSVVIDETDITEYAAVVTAIEFLLDYTEEYKNWIAEIETKTTASDEWASLRKVFGTDLDYVTAELADTYFSNETKAYKRLTDMGYTTLAEAKSELAVADAKIDCLAALDAAETANEIKTQVELAKSKGWITVNGSVSDTEYERMVGFGFDYFSDILAAYDFAIGPDYAEYSIRDGKGGGEILLTDFSSQGYLITEDEGDYIRFSPDGINRHTGAAGDTSWLAIVRNSSANAVNYASPNTAITADIRYVTKGMPFMINFAKPAAFSGTNSAGMSVALIPRELDVWYTYKFEIGSYTADTPVNDYVNVYVKVKGEDDSAYVLLNGLDVSSSTNFTTSDNDMDVYGYIYNLSYASAKQVDIGYNSYRLKHTSWTEDIYNQTVTDMGTVMNVYESSYIAKSAELQNGNGAVVTELPDSGTVTPVYTVKNTGKSCFVDSMVVIYDGNGVMVDLICERKTVVTGEGAEISGPTVDVTAVPKGGRLEALLVDRTDKMRPLADMLALGTLPVIGETDCAETTFSTKANIITVEGTLNQKNENVVVTVKDLSGNILSATQFKTVRQGYFKNTIIIDPELETDETKVKVLVSTAEGVVEEELDMSLNWNGMKTALDGEITESFFDEFADCFVFYESFSNADEKSQAKKVIISFTDADEKTLMTALVNTFAKAGAFNELTSQEILDKLVSIKKNIDEGKVADFENALKTASDAAAIKALITSDDARGFVMFDVTDVSNVDAICGVLAEAEADNLHDILEIFENAKTEQKETESNGLSGAFKAISNKNDMKAFFANENHKTILGIEGVTYTAADAVIMYSVYVHKDYAEIADADVAEAIKFVQNYVHEYNTWIAEVSNSKTTTEEWTAISKVFGELNFVTAELVEANHKDTDASAKDLSKVYARISDLGYTDLEDAGTNLGDDSAVITEKLACIDEVELQANRRNGSSTGYPNLVKAQVKLAADNGWITIDGKLATNDTVYRKMLEKHYNYLADIEAIYNEAVSAGGNDDIGGRPGGGGSTGGTSKKDADSIIINEGTQAGGNTGLNVNGEGHPSAPFKDVTSEYNWAEPSITGLRKYGIILGDGDGNFRPGANIRREEFLSILLKVFKIENKTTTVNFSDVNKNEWYYNAVATAYEMGIVKGYSDGRFGIGDDISRADMAVMVCRTLDILGKAPAAEEVGYIFTDYTDIPDYAYNAVTRLQQMGLVKGDDFRNFYPTNSLTRAEAAVVLWPVFQQSGSMIQ